MNVYSILRGDWLCGILALSPTEKWRAVRLGGGSRGPWWATHAAMFSAVVILAAMLILLVLLRKRRERQAWAALCREAQRRGITGRGFEILAEVVKRAKLKALLAVFMTDVAFDRGAGAYLQSARFARLSSADKHEALKLVESLRAKMDFAQTAGLSSFGPRTTRGLDPGTALTVFRDSHGQSFEAAIASANAVGMAIEADEIMACTPGETLRAQFSRNGQLLEFETTVIRTRDGKTVLDHTDGIRPADRRRFARRLVHLSARAAPFPLKKTRAGEAFQFHDAQVLEVGGPGLRLVSVLSVRPDERMLLEIDLPGDCVIQAVGAVRRLPNQGEGANVYAVEMLTLADEELTELIGEVEQAGRPDRAEATDAPADALKAPAVQGATPV